MVAVRDFEDYSPDSGVDDELGAGKAGRMGAVEFGSIG